MIGVIGGCLLRGLRVGPFGEHAIISGMQPLQRTLRASVAALVIALAVLCVPAISAAPTLQKLKGIEELKAWFNANAGHPRLIFLLSPT